MFGKNNQKMFSLGRLLSGVSNKSQSSYEEQLKLKLYSGEILWYAFEGMKFKLADNTYYSPDFAVMNKDGQIELHEVKGYFMDDAKVKIKVAAAQFPFKFIVVFVKTNPKKNGGGHIFTIEEI